MTRREELLALAVRAEKGETEYGIDKDVWDMLQRCGVAVPQSVSRKVSVSIDAQAALPGRISIMEISQKHASGGGAIFYQAWSSNGRYGGYAIASTEAAARLAALLRAMAEGGE